MDKIVKHGVQLTAGLNPASQKEMRDTLRKIFSEAGSQIDFNTPENKKDIMALATVFRDIFESVGNKKIDFSKILGLSSGKDVFEALKGSANELANVWADVVNKMGSNSLSSIFMKDQSALDAALKNISTKQGKIKSEFARSAKAAFANVTSTDLKELLKTADDSKMEFEAATSWEKREVAALKYLNVYRRIMDITQDGTNIDRLSPDLEAVFKDLDRIGPYATQKLEEAKAYLQTSIQNIFNLANGKSPFGLTGGGAVNFDVAPRLINTLDVGDVLGGKKNISVDVIPEIDPEFASKLTKLFELSKQKGKEAQDQFAQLQSEIVKGLPAGMQDAAIDRLYSFLETKGTDKAIKGVWKDFVGFGGGGTGIGFGAGTGTGVGQADGATAVEIENLEQVRAKVAEIITIVETKTNAFKTEGTEVGKVVDGEIAKLGELENKVNSIKSSLEGLLKNIKTGSNDIGAGLNNITVNVNHQNAEDVKIDASALADAIGKIQVAPDNEGLIAEIRALIPSLGNLVAQEDTLQVIKAILETKDTLVAGKAPPEIKAETSPKRENRFERLNDIASLYEDVEDVDAAIKEFGELYKEIVLIGENATKTIKPNKTGINTLKKIANGNIDLEYDYSWVEFKRNGVQAPTGVAKSNAATLDTEALRHLLNSIIYNVKIAYDDNDKTVNKIALDESALESTLKRVFTNILNPPTEQNDSEPQNEPWALEKTLLSVKEILGQIQANTAKPESIEAAPAKTEVGNVLATENTLAAIKTSVEAINKKVVKGVKSKTSEGGGTKQTGVVKKNAESYAGSQYFPEKIKTQTMYLAKFRAQLMTTGKLTDDIDAQIYGLLDGLKQVQNGPDLSKWTQQFLQLKTSVGIEDIFEKAEDKITTASYEKLIELQKTRNKLELQYQKAQEGSAAKQFYAEQLAQIDSVIVKQEEMLENEEYELKLAKMREEQARKLGEAEAKAADKDAKKQATNAKRLAQREAMLGKAGNAVGRAENTWMNAVGIDGELPAGFNEKINEYYQKLDLLRKKHQELKNSDIISEEQQKDLITQTVSINKMTEEIGELVSEYQRLSGDNTTVIGGTALDSGAGLNAYEQQLKRAVATATNGKAQIKNFDAATKTLTYTVKTGKNEFTEYTAAVRHLDHQLVSVQGTTKRTETFFEATKRKMKELTSYMSGMMLFSRASQEFRRGVQYVREIDLALTELKKVTDETEEAYDKFLDTAAKTGARLGSTISAVTEATATFAKLGYTMEQATEMAESAIVYKNVGDNIENTEEAADSIISTMKGFKLEATESMAIVDRFNEVGNRFAITSKGIGEALRLSASALSEGGNSLDESIGLITAANEVVNDPSSVGTALKTLTLRLRGSKTELEEMGEDVTDMATTTSQLQAKLLALTGGQVDIMLDENTFKNSTQILREMAEAWGDMNDIQRASALELMGGKRQANVLSALIQNFDTVEKAIEASANSAGSALQENERYLDSIQGKIDQFNNSLQAMWNNILEADMVKSFVALGTEIIKIIDKIGLLNSALLAFGAYKGIRHIFNSFKNAGVTLKTVLQYVNSLTVGFKANAAAQVAANGATMASGVANKLFRTEMVKTLATQYLTTQSTQALEQAKYALKLAEMGLMNGIATTKDVQAAQAAVEAASIPVDITKIGTTELMGLAFKQLALSIWGAVKAITAFLFTNPIGWIILAVGAIAGATAIFNHFHKTTEELTEELNGLKNELQGIQEELDSLNSELETTQSRMAELLAMDSLSFTEEEELERLRKQNDELQREIDLQKTLQNSKQKQAETIFKETMEKKLEQKYMNENSGGLAGTYTKRASGWNRFWGADTASGEQALKTNIDVYREKVDYNKKLQEKAVASQQLLESGEGSPLDKWAAKLEIKAYESNSKWLGDLESSITAQLEEYRADIEGIEYGDDPEVNAYLDYVNNTLDRWAIESDGRNAKTNAFNRIFNKDENAVISDSIDKYVEALKNGDLSAKEHIRGIIENNAALKEDILASGLEIDDAVDHFTMFSSSTAGGIMDQYKVAISALEEIKANPFSLNDFVEYDSDTGEAAGKEIEIAEKLKGVGPEVREQFTSIVEEIREGSYRTKMGITDWNAAIKELELKGMQAVIANAKTELEAANKLAFPDLEVTGWIDSVKELSSAFESLSSAMDLVVTAQEQMASGGRVSVKTALDLMATTDDWTKILEVNNGVITMNANAEQILIQSKLDLIKANVEMALQEVETQIALAEGAINSTKAGNAFTEGFTKALTNAQSVLAGLKAGWDAFLAGTDVSDAFNDAYNKTKEKLIPHQAPLDDLYQQRAELEKKLDMIGGVDTVQEFKDNYDFDKTPGDKSGKDDAFGRAMDYWENRLKANQARYEQLQNEIDLLESRGKIAGKEYYIEQIKIERERLDLLSKQRAEAKAYLKGLTEGSDEWWEVAHTLNDLEGEIDGVTASVEDLSEAMRNVDVQVLEEIVDRFSQLSNELSNIRDILSSEDMFDEEGKWAEAGVAVLGTHLQDIGIYKKTLSEIEKELDYLLNGGGEDDYSGNEQAYYDRVKELTNQQHEYTKAIHDSEQSVVEMYESNIDAVEEYTDKLVESYRDYIDNVKEALDAERDLYEFKKNVNKQTKDIATLERRIASLSGSTNASDIAERRRLEADLYGAREELDDTYYNHAKQTQQEALDRETEAYEETMARFIEGMRTSLAEATVDMESFLNSVTIAVSMNADAVLEKYEATGLKLSPELTNPWVAAKEAVGEYGAEALALMNKWTQEGYWADFTTKIGNELSSPWGAGIDAADAFETSVEEVMSSVVSQVESNVESASAKLSTLYQQIIDTEKKAQELGDSSGGDGSENNNALSHKISEDVGRPLAQGITLRPLMKTSKEMILGSKDFVDKNTENINGTKYYRDSKTGYYYKLSELNSKRRYDGGRTTGWAIPKGTWFYTKNAKGTTGTKRDEWGLTDEPWLGDELVLVPTPRGNLSYMRKGTGVVPADLTANLMEWGKFDPNSVNLGGGANISMINNAVNKPEFNLNVDNFLRCDNVSQDTLPELKLFVKEQMNSLMRQMNYSLKKSGAR